MNIGRRNLSKRRNSIENLNNTEDNFSSEVYTMKWEMSFRQKYAFMLNIIGNTFEAKVLLKQRFLQ